MQDQNSVRMTYATLSILGKEVIPDEITVRLGITPFNSYRPNERQSQSGAWPYGYWSISSKNQLQSMKLENHIEWILDQIDPVIDQLIDICRHGVKTSLSCFWESATDHGEFAFEPVLLGRLAKLNVELRLDLYFDS